MKPTNKPTEKANTSKFSAKMWASAIQEAQQRAATLERDRRRLLRAIRLMRRQLRDGVPWPVGESQLTGQESN